MQARVIRHHEFARPHVPQETRADDVKRGRFRSEHVAAVQLADDEGPHPVAVAQAENLVLVHDDHAEAAF